MAAKFKGDPKQMGALDQAAAEGSSEAEALRSDYAAETYEREGPEDKMDLHRGKKYMIYTATHFFCGTLLGETYEYYILDVDSVQVFETGAFATFYGRGEATDCEKVPVIRRIRKGGTICVDDWPHKELPTKRTR